MQKTGKGLAATGLVMGIFSLLLFWVPVVNIVALACGIMGICFSAAGRKRALGVGNSCGVGMAGLVLSIIGTVFAAIGFFTCTVCTTVTLCATGRVEDFMDIFDLFDSL